MNAALNSEMLMGSFTNGVVTKGYLAKYGIPGINTLAESALANPSTRSAFVALALVASYLALRPKIDRLTSYLESKGTGLYNYIAEAIS